MSLDDFTVKQGAGRMPKAWTEVRDNLLKQCPQMILEKRAARFVRELVTALSQDAQMPNDDEKFIKNFKNALKFVPIDSPTRFVRRITSYNVCYTKLLRLRASHQASGVPINSRIAVVITASFRVSKIVSVIISGSRQRKCS